VIDAPIVSWVKDPVLPGFEAVSMPLAAEDDGPLVATLVRRRARTRTGKAVLYLHGFVDYFFHGHVADALLARGWDVYALDLRRSGRSLRTGNRPYFARDLRDYFEEISLAVAVIVNEPDHRLLCLTGHSTGGLIASLYMADGAHRARIQALALNSPFVAFNASALERAAMPLVTSVGGGIPHLPIPGVLAPAYVQSLHRTLKGEWNFDLRWKPEAGFPAYAGWLRAVRAGHQRVARGLGLEVPVLQLRSATSVRARGWDERVRTADAVLDVAHMQAAVPRLGAQVTDVALDGAMHDVFLSRADVRARALEAYGQWLDALKVPLLVA
jgi:alpha-beta hydrolase superfamily lysophospholipase